MPVRRCHIPVNASLERVWSLLLERLERNQSGAEPSPHWAVVDRGKGWLLRDVQLPSGQHFRERITVDETRHTLSTVLEHPRYEGIIIDRVRTRQDSVELESAMDWRFRPGTEPGCEDPWSHVRRAIEHTRAMAEEATMNFYDH